MTPLTATQIERVLLIAATQVGVTECPPNTNSGLKVEQYLASVGLSKGQPWCAAAVAWIGIFALGAGWPLPKTGGCAALGDWAAKAGVLVAAPQVGDVFLLYFPALKRFAHTGFIHAVHPNGLCSTYEGNTSGGGSREGWMYADRSRSFGAEDRFIRLGAL